MDELIIRVIDNAPSIAALLYIIYKQSKQLDRLIGELIKRENCDDVDDIARTD